MERWLGPVLMAAGVLLLVVGVLIAVFLPLEGAVMKAVPAQLIAKNVPAEEAPIIPVLDGLIQLTFGKVGTYLTVAGLFVGILLCVVGAGLVLVGYIVLGLIKMALGALQALAGG